MNHEVRSIGVDDIEVADRLRALDQGQVATLAASMAEIGLRTPISVRILHSMVIAGEKVLEVPVLVAGAHRLAAAKMLAARGDDEWQRIDCLVVPDNDADTLLWEIDENLCRAELSPVQVAEHAVRRKAAYLERHPETAAAFHGNQHTGNVVSDNLSFTKDTAAKTGLSRRTIERGVRRGERIAPDVRHDVVGTKLDTGVSLDRLAELTHEEQRKVVEAGGFPPPPPAPLPSAAEVVKPSESPPEDDLELCLVALIQILRTGLSGAQLSEAAYLASIIGNAITIADTFRAAAENDGE
jgi:hypothetical protein